MAAKYPSTKETTNFARICRVLVGVVPDLLRHLLDTLLPGDKLKDKIKNTTAKKLQLNGSQKKTLYPPDGFQGSVEDFDGTLLCLLIRNLEIDLDKDGRTVSANVHEHVDCLREQRNEAYGHATKPSVSDEDFEKVWSIIYQSVDEIQRELPKKDFLVAMDEIRAMDMNHTTVERYKEEFLEEMTKSLEELKDIGIETRDTVNENRDDIKELNKSMALLGEDVSSLKDVLNNPSSGKSHIRGLHGQPPGTTNISNCGFVQTGCQNSFVFNYKGESPNKEEKMEVDVLPAQDASPAGLNAQQQLGVDCDDPMKNSAATRPGAHEMAVTGTRLGGVPETCLQDSANQTTGCNRRGQDGASSQVEQGTNDPPQTETGRTSAYTTEFC